MFFNLVIGRCVFSTCTLFVLHVFGQSSLSRLFGTEVYESPVGARLFAASFPR